MDCGAPAWQRAGSHGRRSMTGAAASSAWPGGPDVPSVVGHSPGAFGHNRRDRLPVRARRRREQAEADAVDAGREGRAPLEVSGFPPYLASDVEVAPVKTRQIGRARHRAFSADHWQSEGRGSPTDLLRRCARSRAGTSASLRRARSSARSRRWWHAALAHDDLPVDDRRLDATPR